MNLPTSCDTKEMVSVDLSDGLEPKDFFKVKSVTHDENIAKGWNYTYWYGENEIDGSTLNYIQDEHGHIQGSLVDIASNQVLQFQIGDGTQSALITNSSDFLPEIEVQGPKQKPEKRKIRGAGRGAEKEFFLSSIQEELGLPLGEFDDNGGNLDIMVVRR